MRERYGRGLGQGPPISHSARRRTCSRTRRNDADYGATAPASARYIHDAAEAKELGASPARSRLEAMAEKSDVLFYEGLHGGYKDGGWTSPRT